MPNLLWAVRPAVVARAPRRLLLASVGVSALLLYLASEGRAAPDVCGPDGPGSVVCTGDQSDGIVDGTDFDPTLIERLTIRDLTADIAPAAGIDGVVFRRQDGDLRIVTEAGDFAIVTGGGANGIVAELENELPFFGAMLGIENNLDILAAGTGIFAHSLTDGEVDQEWDASQSNATQTIASAEADDGSPNEAVADNDADTQPLNTTQDAFNSLPSSAGAIEIENAADIEAGDTGILALSELDAETRLATIGVQENDAAQDATATASSASNTPVSATVDATQDYDQIANLDQGSVLADGADAAGITIANSGTVTAGGDGIVGGSAVFLDNMTEQELLQDGRAEQSGLALADAVQADGSATATVEQTQELQQLHGGTQEIGGPAWEAAGAVTIDNSGTIAAGGDGIVATAELEAFSQAFQTGLQNNLSSQDAGAVADASDGEATARLDALQDVTRLSAIQQSATVGGLADAASLSVTNSGLIDADGDGIVAEAGVLTASIGAQILGQDASGLQFGYASSEQSDGEATSEAEVSQRNLQIATGVQELEGRDGAGVGAVTIGNSGLVVAGGDGILAGSARLSVAAATQLANQTGGSGQQADVSGDGSDEAALAVSQDGESGSTALQSQRHGTGADAGAVTVDNSGQLLTGGDGIMAITQMLLLSTTVQQQEQIVASQQDTTALGNVGLDQQQSETGNRYSEQSARFLYGQRTGAVTIDNSGLVSAGGDGLVALSQIAAAAEVFQEVYQEQEALQSLSGGVGGNQDQEMERSSVSDQSVLVRLGERVGAVSVDNSGVVIAGGDGIVAQAEVVAGLLAEQFVQQFNSAEQALFDSGGAVQRQGGTQHNAADQRIQLQLRDGVGSVEVDNSGVVIAEGDGIFAASAIALVVEVDSEVHQEESTSSTLDNSPGAVQSRDLVMENLAEQRVEVTMADTVGAVTVRNSGVVVASGDGIVAGSQLFLDGDLPSGLRAGGVDLQMDGLVIADGTAIRAFSFVETDQGLGPGGDITVRVGEDGIVVGGSGYAVDIDGGADNRLVNRGVIVSDSNRAVRGGAGDERIVNFGTIVGNVDLGGGANSFANRSGALFETGRRVNLGAGGRLTNAGTLSPGGVGSIQRTVVQGDLHQRSGSTYLVDIDAEGRSDRLAVEGGVTIETGSTVQVQRAAGNYDVGGRYRILTATQGIQGEFDELEQGRLPFLELQLGYRTRLVYLDIGRSGTAFADVAQSANQRSVARALGSLDRNNAAYRAIVWLDEKEAAEAYDNLSGELHATTQGLSGEIARRLRTLLLDRIGGRGTGFSSGLQSGNLASLVLPASDADPVAPPAPERPGPQFWMQAFGATGSQDGDGNAASSRNATWGTMLGAEMLLSESFGIGLAAGYQNDRLEVDSRQSRADIDSYSLAAYGLWRQGPWRVRGGAGFAWHEFESRRDITVPGLGGTAKARYSGWTGQTFGEVGYRIDLEAVSLEPFAGLSFHHSRTESHRERGAGAANLDVRSDRHSELVSTLGVQATQRFELSGGVELRPHASLAWEHRLAGSRGDADIGFVAGGNRFRVSGPTRNRNAALVGAGLDIRIGDDFEAFGAYDLHLSRSHRDHTARAGVRLRF